jgi:hypothetical protein
VSQGGAGVQVWDLAGFVEAVRNLTADAARREFLGTNARAWVSSRHAPEVVASVFEEAVGLGAAAQEVR